MSFAFPADWLNSQRNTQRAAAISLLVIIHVLALSILMTSKQASAPLPRAVREIMLSFPVFHPRPLPQKSEQAKTKAHMRTQERSSSPEFVLPPGTFLPPTQTQPGASVGHSLFGCDPATMLNPDEQSGCGAFAATPGAEEVGLPKVTHVVQTARWMHELEIKHSRRIVPCVGFFGPVFAVDPICVANGLINGFGEPK